MSALGAHRHGERKRILLLAALDELARHKLIGERRFAEVEHHLRRMLAESAMGARPEVLHGYSLRHESAYSRVRNGTRTTSASCASCICESRAIESTSESSTKRTACSLFASVRTI